MVIALSFFQGSGDASAKTSCQNHQFLNIVSLSGDHPADVCEASQKAIEFLARYDLHLKRPVTIELVETSINNRGYIAFGSYDRSQDKIRLMSYEAIMAGTAPQMYDQPFDMEHYHGAIAHEIAHAVFQHNTAGIEDQLTNATQEYLAHATQLGVLSPQRRRQIIEASEVGPWESGDSVSEIYMSLNPSGFAVKSYLHLSKLDNPQPFIAILLRNNWFYLSVP
ncbi:MAG: hypothetical protein HKP44_03890 [Desulfofustis sp.]|nr:hypothetical protein [Desulfofustis sp.]